MRVRARGGPIEAGGFANARIGIPEYQMTAIVWMRGILGEFHGVELQAVQWVRAG